MHFVFNIAHTIRKWYWREFSIKTFGVRVLLLRNNKVLLVQHRYGDLWVLPGGGMKRNDDIFDAAQKEAREEVSIEIDSFECELGVYSNTQSGKDDTVRVVVAKKWREYEWKPNIEIKKREWFNLDFLPETTSKATKRRIVEYIDNDIQQAVVRLW